MQITRPPRIALPLALAMLVLALVPATALAHARAGTPKTRTPKGYITTATPTLTWTAVAGAQKYDVAVCQAITVKPLFKKNGVTKRSWKLSSKAPMNMDLIWKVRARTARGAGRWSKFVEFRVVTVADPAAPQVGQLYGGGVVAYLFQPGDAGYVAGQPHGLIVAKADETTWQPWSNVTDIATMATGTAIGTGRANTAVIVAQTGCTSGAAYSCFNKRDGGLSDWYLPSRDELGKLSSNRTAIGGVGFTDGVWNYYYWSSSEYDATRAFCEMWGVSVTLKGYMMGLVRAVRTF